MLSQIIDAFVFSDRLFPEWKIWTQFLTDTFSPALTLDALETSHPIEVEVEDPAQIDEIFDMISYNKGSSIIRMLFSWLGEDAFRSGMNRYLNEKKHGNASTEDLWSALEQEGKPVGKVMSTWTEKMGFPIISIANVRPCEDLKKVIFDVKQKRFTFSDAQHSNDLWSIPLSVTSASSPENPVFSGLLTSQSESVVIEGVEDVTAWFNFNPRSIGYFLVSYPNEMLDKFLPAIENKTLPAEDRLKLLFDQLCLAKCGQLPTQKLLEMIEKYRGDDNVTVWECVENCINQIRHLLQGDSKAIESFDAWVCWLFMPSMEKLTWTAAENEHHLNALFRALVVRVLAKSNCEKVHLECEERFQDRGISADLRSTIYSVKLKRGKLQAFEELMKMSAETNSSEEKIRIDGCLGGSGEREVIERALEYALSDKVRYQDTRNVLAAVANGSPLGRDLTWQLFQAKKDEFKRRYNQGTMQGRIVQDILNSFVEESAADEIEKFFTENSFPEAAMKVRQSVEKIRMMAEWKKRDKASIINFLTARTGSIMKK